MLKHEKLVFFKFFSIYFGSVALLILASGFFYYGEQKKSLIEQEHFSIIEYTRQLKMNMNPSNKYIKYEKLKTQIKDFSMANFEVKENRFEKYMPYSWEGGFFLVTKDKQHFNEKLFEVKISIIVVQILLLLLFGAISYFLALKALGPMRDAILKLDNFSKDLIHDLNTPVTSMLLNIKLLDENEELKKLKALARIKRSAQDISELHTNLTHLLHEESINTRKEAVFEIVDEVVSEHKKLYKGLNFYVEHAPLQADVNAKALKQVITNIVSNACKYNNVGGSVKVYAKKRTLYIEDDGVGISHPQNVFQRSYKEHKSGYGIGLHIVKRLCDAMSIEVNVDSKREKGSVFSLEFSVV